MIRDIAKMNVQIADMKMSNERRRE